MAANEQKVAYEVDSLRKLVLHKTFGQLTLLQAVYDNADKIFTQKPGMTRSPIHAVTFLIGWAALNLQDRTKVIEWLNTHDERALKEKDGFSEERLKKLIEQTDWKKVISTMVDTKNNVYANLQFKLEVAEPSAFIAQLQKRFPSLAQTLNQYKLVKRSEDKNSIVFWTTVNQKIKWDLPFKPGTIDSQKDRMQTWEIPPAIWRLSPALQKLVTHKPLEKKIFPNFTIMPCNKTFLVNSNNKTTQLHLDISNFDENTQQFFFKQPRTQVKAGIYNAFLGTHPPGTDFIVREVAVYIQGNAILDRFGANAMQIQEVRESKGISMGPIPLPPKIVLTGKQGPTLFFCSTGIAASFPSASTQLNENLENAEQQATPSNAPPLCSIQLNVQNKNIDNQASLILSDVTPEQLMKNLTSKQNFATADENNGPSKPLVFTDTIRPPLNSSILSWDTTTMQTKAPFSPKSGIK